MFVTSAMIETLTPKEVKENFCVTLRSTCYMSRKVPLRCRRCIADPKIRILGQAHSTIENSMYIHDLLQKLRVTEGIVREKLKLTEIDWQSAVKKYGPLDSQTLDVNDMDLLRQTKEKSED